MNADERRSESNAKISAYQRYQRLNCLIRVIGVNPRLIYC